jgi:hypothetical protein
MSKSTAEFLVKSYGFKVVNTDKHGLVCFDPESETLESVIEKAENNQWDDIKGLHLISRIGDSNLSEEEFWKEIQTEISSFDNPNTFPHL